MRRERMLVRETRSVKRHGPRGLFARDLEALERASRAYQEARAARLRVEAQLVKAPSAGAC